MKCSLIHVLFYCVTNRISDFGEARGIESIQQTMTMTAGIGTPFYMAPEMMNNSKLIHQLLMFIVMDAII